MNLYVDISDNLPIDPNFKVSNIDNTKQIGFYSYIDNILKTPTYTNVLTSIKWNTYYYKKYRAENKLLYFIIGICILIIILNILKKSFSYFDDISYSVFIGIILAYSFIHILYILWTITYKDDLNFDENDYMFNNTHIVGPGQVSPNVIIPSNDCAKTTNTPSNIDTNTNSDFISSNDINNLLN
jgi:hypothetical protein